MTALYFQFGRYLLISSSRPGNSAGQFAGYMEQRSATGTGALTGPTNCNAQINYWPVESANLSECHLPLIDMTREASIDGAKTARNLYDCGGWIAHHNLICGGQHGRWEVQGHGQYFR